MKCRMCGYEFDENNVPNRGCSGCGKHGCQSVHCPNCGFGNSPELDEEFDFIIKLKDKIKNKYILYIPSIGIIVSYLLFMIV